MGEMLTVSTGLQKVKCGAAIKLRLVIVELQRVLDQRQQQ